MGKMKCVYCNEEIGEGYFCVNTSKGLSHKSCFINSPDFDFSLGETIKDCEDSRVWNVLNLLVEGHSETRLGFAPQVAVALREYADKIDNGDGAKSNPEVFTASNNCEVKIIAAELLNLYGN